MPPSSDPKADQAVQMVRTERGRSHRALFHSDSAAPSRARALPTTGAAARSRRAHRRERPPRAELGGRLARRDRASTRAEGSRGRAARRARLGDRGPTWVARAVSARPPSRGLASLGARRARRARFSAAAAKPRAPRRRAARRAAFPSPRAERSSRARARDGVQRAVARLAAPPPQRPDDVPAAPARVLPHPPSAPTSRDARVSRRSSVSRRYTWCVPHSQGGLGWLESEARARHRWRYARVRARGISTL